MNIPKPLIKLSIFVNNKTGGPKGWSLCARTWQSRLDGNPHAKAACAVIDRIFWFDPSHCRKAWLLRSS